MFDTRARPSLFLLVCVLAAVVVLLVFVGNVETITFQPRGAFEVPTATNTGGGTEGLWGADGFALFLRVLFALAIGAWVFQLVISRISRRVYLILAAIALCLVGIMLLVDKIPTQPATVEVESEDGPPPVEGHAAQPEEPVYEASQTDYLLLAIILSSAAVLIGALLLGLWLKKRRDGRAVFDTDELYESLSDAANRIRMGEDPYAVVLYCYQEMMRILGKVGHINATCLTPREFERSLSTFGISDMHIRQLTEIFEVVRYGDKIDDAFPRRALACLDAIQEAHQTA